MILDTPSFAQLNWIADTDGSSFSTMPSMTKVNLWTPSAANDNAYNHHAETIVFNSACYVMVSTHKNDEEDKGQFIRYSYSNACDGTWTSMATLSGSMDTMDSTASSRANGREQQPNMWANISGTLYAIIDVTDVTNQSPFTRVAVGELAISVNGATLGTPCWIEPDSAPTAIGGFPSYSLCSEPLKTNLKEYMYSPTRGISQGWGLPSSSYDDTVTGCGNTLLERSGFVSTDNYYMRTWRCVNGTDGTGNTVFVYSQNSINGLTWSTPLKTTFPNSPSRVRFKKISDNRWSVMGNPNDATVRDPMYYCQSDDLTFQDNNCYKVCTGESNTPVYSGQSKHGGCSYVDFSCINESGGVCTRVLSAYSKQKEKVEVAIFDVPTLN